MSDTRLTLMAGAWYGMTMYPGYAGIYHSPVYIEGVQALGNRQFGLRFLNIAYAAGVQNFEVIFRTLKRGLSYIAVEPANTSERLYLFEPLTATWLTSRFPDLPRSAMLK